VRQNAGLFDCTHMGVHEIEGRAAEIFIFRVFTNDIRALTPGRASYGFLLEESGHVIDDLIVFRRSENRFMLVVNAVNDAIDYQWLNARLDDIFRKLTSIRDLRDPSSGADRRVNIALQGPASATVMEAWSGDKGLAERAAALKPLAFFEARVGEVEVIISRTGYTGSKVGFELLVPPEQAGAVWDGLLAAGELLGLRRCGLGARDSLRIEAGLPLYGHELNGEYDISPFAAGYGWAVKLDKPGFVGREAMKVKAALYNMQVERIELPGEKGVRPVREHDAVLNGRNVCIGTVLSCAQVGDKQIALVYVNRGSVQPGDKVGIYYLARNQRHKEEGRKEKVETGEIIVKDIRGRVLERFAKF
jgi:glycine cleavage system T protein